MKLSERLPPHLAAEVYCAQFNDAEVVRTILAEPRRVVVEGLRTQKLDASVDETDVRDGSRIPPD